MKYVNGGYVFEPDEHCLMTGQIVGMVTTQDGTPYDVSSLYIAVAEKHAEEVAHLISLRFLAEGHPNHTEETPFTYEVPEQFVLYKPHPDNDTLRG